MSKRPHRGSKSKSQHKPKGQKNSDGVEDIKVRINKYIADAGICSRREADKLIAAGEITLNGEVVTEMGVKIGTDDVVKYKGKPLKKERFVYILINKPKDYITTMKDEQGRKTVLDLIAGACSERVYPVGRLDRNTTGLLLLTNDGALTKRLTHPSSNIMKTYIADVDKPVSAEHLAQLTEGVELEDGISKFDEVSYNEESGSQKSIVVNIHSGKNRIVRRTFEALGYDVKKLDRVAFATLRKGAVTRGKWRFLNRKEVGFLKMT